MAPSETYSIEQLLNFRAEDLEGLVYESPPSVDYHTNGICLESFLEVTDWAHLTEVRREECLEKLR